MSQPSQHHCVYYPLHHEREPSTSFLTFLSLKLVNLIKLYILQLTDTANRAGQLKNKWYAQVGTAVNDRALQVIAWWRMGGWAQQCWFRGDVQKYLHHTRIFCNRRALFDGSYQSSLLHLQHCYTCNIIAFSASSSVIISGLTYTVFSSNLVLLAHSSSLHQKQLHEIISCHGHAVKLEAFDSS